jgi:hypothetical protein
VDKRYSRPLFAVAVLAAGGTLPPESARGQGQRGAADSFCPDDHHAVFHHCALTAARTADPPRTADGRPDFSGYWRRRTWAFEDFEAHPENPDDFGGPSVVVDPPDGNVPIQPWAEAKRLENAEQYIHHNAACILSGPAGTMYMTSRFQFIQDSDTLVVTTTHIDWPYLDPYGTPQSADVQYLERFELSDDQTMLNYSLTATDPVMFTAPIIMERQRRWTPGVEIPPFNCVAEWERATD